MSIVNLWWNEIRSRIPEFNFFVSGITPKLLLITIGFGITVAFSIFLLLLFLKPSHSPDLKPIFHRKLHELRNRIQKKTSNRINQSGYEAKIFKKFAELVEQAGKPFGLEPTEWYFLIFGGTALTILCTFGQVIMDLIFYGIKGFPIALFTFLILLNVVLPLWYLRTKANYRRTILFYDFLRTISRLSEYIDFNLSRYELVRRSMASTRLLKEFTPKIDEWNSDPMEALNRIEKRVGIKEGAMLTNTIRYCIENTVDNTKLHLIRIESSLRLLRQEEERMRLKKLEAGFMFFIIPSFCIAFITLALPWYVYLKEMLNSFM